MPDPKDPVQVALETLESDFPDSHLTYVRDDTGKRVVRKLRGNFTPFGPFLPGTFDKVAVATSIQQFWSTRRALFDPNPDGSPANVSAFAVTGLSARLAIVTGQQVTIVSGNPVAISGAILTARIAARPAKDPKPNDPVPWQLDGFDNNLVTAASLSPGLAPPASQAVKAASLAVFGRADVLAASADLQIRTFPGVDGQRSCYRIAYPAQRRLIGTWKRGAVVYWPLDLGARQPFYVEPDGSYQTLPGNTGPYHAQATGLEVRPVAGTGRHELIDETLWARGGPAIRTGRIQAARRPVDLPKFVPLEGTGWHDNQKAPSRINPGVATDAHAFAHDMVKALLDLRDANKIEDAILPDPVNVAIQVSPAAQPGEWRKSGSAVIIANADDSLPRSWMKRWTYCSDVTVMAHEIAHAFVYERSTLDYCLESGALDEGLADLFAVLLTRTEAIFDRPWVREDTRYFRAAAALRSASWSTPLRQAPLTPNDRVERGEYPNHYADFARLNASIEKSVKRSSARNDHGYIHWNCAILTRALAMLARESGAVLVHPETQLTASALGPLAIARLAFCTVWLGLKGSVFTNRTGAETPFAQFRAALLAMATSAQFDGLDEAHNDMRLFAAQIINAFNAAGLGPILSVRGRPADVPERYMPAITLPQPGWIMKFEQEGRNERTWNPDDAEPIDLVRGKGVEVTTRIANLAVSTDRASPALSVLLEIERDNHGQPAKFKSVAFSGEASPLCPRKVTTQAVRLSAEDLPDFDDPWIMVMASDRWNAMRANATARAAIRSAAQVNGFCLPLNAALIRLRLGNAI